MDVPICLRLMRAVLASAICLAPLNAGPVPTTTKPAHYPDWWFTRDVIPRLSAANSNPTWPNDYPISDDYAVANIGQLKHIAQKAALELDAYLPDGSGNSIQTLINNWQDNSPAALATRDDYAALNQGQLKAVAELYYARLIQQGFNGAPLDNGQTRPWSSNSIDDDAYAIVNLGQLKHIFSFETTNLADVNFERDTDGDGIPDWWEIERDLDQYDPNDALLPIGNISYRDAYQQSQNAYPDPSLYNQLNLITYTP